MTRNSIKEYAEAIKNRYRIESKHRKSRILDEFTKATGLHRKAAIRLLNCRSPATRRKRSGRPPRYGIVVVEALRVVWEISDRLCSKRLHPFLPEIIKVLRRCGENKMTAEIEAELCRMSPSTIDRLLQPWKQKGGRRSFSTTKPGSLLRSAIPIRTFADWQDKRPGFVEVDLVAHCGESVDGFYLNTLMAVDVATGGRSLLEYGGKDNSAWARQSIVYNNDYHSNYSGWTQTTAASSSIRISPGGVIMKVLPSPGPGLIRKMIIVLLNRRTGLLCAGSSVEIVTAQNSLTKRSTESIIYYACMSISSNR